MNANNLLLFFLYCMIHQNLVVCAKMLNISFLLSVCVSCSCYFCYIHMLPLIVVLVFLLFLMVCFC